MNHTEFFKALHANKIMPCYLFEGTEEYTKEAALAQLKQRLITADLEALNFTQLENPQADEVIAACETLPFMSDKRVNIIRNCALLTSGKAKDETAQAQRLAEYLPNIPPSTCLIFYVRGKADGRKSLYKSLKKLATIVSFDPLRDDELIKWIMQTVKVSNKQITPQNASKLAFTAGSDATLLKGEIQKLIAYIGERDEIIDIDIDAVAVRSIECTVFDMVDAIVANQEENAFDLLKRLLENGGDRISALAMLLRQYRILYHLKAMQAGNIAHGEITGRLGIPPFAVTRAMRQSKAYTIQQLKQAVDMCIETDYLIKNGRINQEGSLERVIFELCRLLS